mgnify:CR=1 FL=1
MKVKQLMNKLKKCNPEATVYVPNSDLWVNGLYVATEIEYNDERNEVLIDTDHVKGFVY